MARNKRGVHAPNNWGTWYDLASFLALIDTVSHCTMLDGEADLVPVLRQHGVDGTLLVRFYLPRWPEQNPEQWAEHCSVEYLRDRAGWTLDSRKAHITPANEMNLAEEGGGPGQDLDTQRGIDWYQRINEWLLRWHTRFVQLVPGVSDRLHFPAFAYGHSDDDNTRGYCGMEICRPSIMRFAVLDCHPYWFTPGQVADPYYGHRFELSHALFPTKPIFLSEAGNFDTTRASSPDEFAQWFASLSAFPYITGATPFIFRDPTGAHAANNWGANLAIEQRVIAMAGAPVVTPPPATEGDMTEAELLRYAQDIWRRFNAGWNSNGAICKYWLAHLKAGGALGYPLETEHPTENGKWIVQGFSNGFLKYNVATGVTSEGLPL